MRQAYLTCMYTKYREDMTAYLNRKVNLETEADPISLVLLPINYL